MRDPTPQFRHILIDHLLKILRAVFPIREIRRHLHGAPNLHTSKQDIIFVSKRLAAPRDNRFTDEQDVIIGELVCQMYHCFDAMRVEADQAFPQCRIVPDDGLKISG